MLQSFLPSIFILGLAALAALILTRSRRSPAENRSQRLAASRALALATGIQAMHFAEEAATGFHERLGPVFGLPEMPFSFFMAFNLAWLGIWIVSIPGVRSAYTGAFFAAWFLAIAGMFNGIGHPLLAAAAGGYFPGLLSSPFIAGASIWLWLRLRRATRVT
jgi:hypothetical protein